MPLGDNASNRLNTALADPAAGKEVLALLNTPYSDSANAVFTGTGNVAMATGQKVSVVNKAAGAATQVTLPASPATWQYATVIDGKGDAATNNITVVPAAGTIDGAANALIKSNYGDLELLYNGTEWNVVGNNNFSTSDDLTVPGLLTAGNAKIASGSVQTKTGDYPLTQADSGSSFDNTGAVGSVNFTVPAVASSKGFWAEFFCVVDQQIAVTAPAGTLVGANNAGRTSYTTAGAGNRIGVSIYAYCNGAKWFLIVDNKGLTNGTYA